MSQTTTLSEPVITSEEESSPEESSPEESSPEKSSLETIPEESFDSDDTEDHGILSDHSKEQQTKILNDVGDQIEELVDEIVGDYLNHFLPSQAIDANYFAEHRIVENPKAPIRDRMFFWAMNQMARDMRLRDPEAFILQIYGRNAGWKPKQPNSSKDQQDTDEDTSNGILYYMPWNLTTDIQFITGGGETQVIKSKETLMPFEIVNGNGPYVVAGRTKWTVDDTATGKRKCYIKRSEKDYCCCILWMCWAEDPPYDFCADDYSASEKYTQMMKFTELITGDMLSGLDHLEDEDNQEKSEELKATEAELRRLKTEMEQLRAQEQVKHEDNVIATF